MASASMQSFVSLAVASLTVGILVPLVQASLMHLALLSAFSVWFGLALWRVECRLSAQVV